MKRLIPYLTFLVSALLMCSCQAAQNQDQTPVAPESDDILVSFTESTSSYLDKVSSSKTGLNKLFEL